MLISSTNPANLATMIPFLLPLILCLIFNKRINFINRIFSVIALAAFYLCMIAEIIWEETAPYISGFSSDSIKTVTEHNISASSYLFILLLLSLIIGFTLVIISRKTGKPDPFFIFWAGGSVSVLITTLLYVISAVSAGPAAFGILKYGILRLLIILLLFNFTFNSRNTPLKKAIWFHLPFISGLILCAFSITGNFIAYGASDEAVNNAYYNGIAIIVITALYYGVNYFKNHNTLSKLGSHINSAFSKMRKNS